MFLSQINLTFSGLEVVEPTSELFLTSHLYANLLEGNHKYFIYANHPKEIINIILTLLLPRQRADYVA